MCSSLGSDRNTRRYKLFGWLFNLRREHTAFLKLCWTLHKAPITTGHAILRGWPRVILIQLACRKGLRFSLVAAAWFNAVAILAFLAFFPPPCWKGTSCLLPHSSGLSSRPLCQLEGPRGAGCVLLCGSRPPYESGLVVLPAGGTMRAVFPGGWRKGAGGVCQLPAANTQLFVDGPAESRQAGALDASGSYTLVLSKQTGYAHCFARLFVSWELRKPLLTCK